MARLVLCYRDEAGELKRKRYEGKEVSYGDADGVLGEDFVKIQVDSVTLVIPKKDLVHLRIQE